MDDETVTDGTFTDMERGENVNIPSKDINEPSFGIGQGGKRDTVYPGNKEFITGQLLNWTLSNTTNRLVLTVGVAYGADTERVRTALEESGTPVGVVGSVESGSGVYLDGEASEAPDGDSAWPVYERLLGESSGE